MLPRVAPAPLLLWGRLYRHNAQPAAGDTRAHRAAHVNSVGVVSTLLRAVLRVPRVRQAGTPRPPQQPAARAR